MFSFGGAVIKPLSDAGWALMMKPMAALLGDTTNLIFFQRINAFLRREIDEFGVNLLGRTMGWAASIALTLLTLWIIIQGFRIATGQSRDSMMALVVNSLRSTFIIALATGFAFGGSNIFKFLSDDVTQEITTVVTGHDTDVYKQIDKSLGWMQAALMSIDQLDVGESEIINDAKERNKWFTGVGTGGPAITAGIMLLFNKIAMALFIGFGPLFILALLFDQTKSLFQKWLFYGIATMFSLAVLSVMVSLAMDMIIAVAGAFWVGKFVGANQEGLTSMSMQQGGLGIILSMLIMSAPPMAAAFFNGVLGNFQNWNAFSSGSGGQQAAQPGSGAPPGGYGGYGGNYDGGQSRGSSANTTADDAGRGGSTGRPGGGYNNPNQQQTDTMKSGSDRRELGQNRDSGQNYVANNSGPGNTTSGNTSSSSSSSQQVSGTGGNVNSNLTDTVKKPPG